MKNLFNIDRPGAFPADKEFLKAIQYNTDRFRFIFRNFPFTSGGHALVLDGNHSSNFIIAFGREWQHVNVGKMRTNLSFNISHLLNNPGLYALGYWGSDKISITGENGTVYPDVIYEDKADLIYNADVPPNEGSWTKAVTFHHLKDIFAHDLEWTYVAHSFSNSNSYVQILPESVLRYNLRLKTAQMNLVLRVTRQASGALTVFTFGLPNDFAAKLPSGCYRLNISRTVGGGYLDYQNIDIDAWLHESRVTVSTDVTKGSSTFDIYIQGNFILS